ncbi:TetR/AcrR family transcriptional regulator [Sphingorhabdus sp. Alg239-R122]|uniref:TetR/AcrR family transcriptional regulator n=1 Tax=Sphingorhabdus sp. Alg239-R122 TaxID=2305989 RepID=UPI0013D9FB2D|nr:TetR/AcrR family transcriptional regulator [Sphingorhabdus sp. Alg239-R122]
MRPARFKDVDIIEAALAVAAREGPAGASIAKIAAQADAPTGSIYHRFRSRDVLLGEVWLKAVTDFQNAYIKLLDGSDVERAALDAALFVPRYVRENTAEARLMLLHRREDFLVPGWPVKMLEQAEMLGRQMQAAQQHFCRKLTGRDDRKTMRILCYAMVEAPMGAVRPYLEKGGTPPPLVDSLVEATFHAAMALTGGDA